MTEYEFMKLIFLKHVETNTGPHRLDVAGLAKIYTYLQSQDGNIMPIAMKQEVIMPIWRRMALELCPYQMQVDETFDIEGGIKDVDDNKNYIYTSSRSVADKSVRLLNVSNPSIAAMLRIKNVK